MSAHMLKVTFEQLHEGAKVTGSHGFNDEVLIVREKEEATTFTLRLTCLEDALPVEFRTQALFDLFNVDSIEVSQKSKEIRGELCHLDVLIDNKHIFID